MNKRIKKLKELYSVAKAAKVGEIVECPSCNSKFTKSHYAQAFCKTLKGTRCKDNYWNNVTPKKRCNTTRISPASRRFMARKEANYEIYYDEHPFSSEALGQW